MGTIRTPDQNIVNRKRQWFAVKFAAITLTNSAIVYFTWCNSFMAFQFFNSKQYKSDLYFIAKDGFSTDYLAGYYEQMIALLFIIIAGIVSLIIAVVVFKTKKVWIFSLCISILLVLVIANTYGSVMRWGGTGTREGSVLQNMYSINLAFGRYSIDFFGYPLSIYETDSLISDGYMEYFPENDFNHSPNSRQSALLALNSLNKRTEEILRELWLRAEGSLKNENNRFDLSELQTALFNTFSFITSEGVTKYGVDMESLSIVVPYPSRRFGNDMLTMGDLCFGYELGCDLINWWDMFPKNKELDSQNADRKTYREFARGNFVYLPLDKDGKPIPYDKAPTDFKAFFDGKPISKQKHTAPGFLLVLFGSPDYSGLDVWTPTGDPTMPVALTPDSIPDGVIMSVIRLGEEEKIEVF